MDYVDIRKKFCEVSGHYELMNADYTDNGADFLLNAAQRYLDRTHDFKKGAARNVQAVTASQIKVQVTGLRAVKEVWFTNSDGSSQWPLEKCSLGEIRDYYGKKLSSEDTGDVAYYAPVAFRPAPDTVTTATWTGYQDIEDLILDDTHYQYNGVILMPPPSEAGYIAIVGLFWSPTLSATYNAGVWTQTKSYWTENHPEVLIEAAIMRMHGLYMNTTGFEDYKKIVGVDIAGLDQDSAEEDVAGESQMGG